MVANSGVKTWFVNFTSIGGLSQHFASRGSYSKTYWLVLFLVGLGFTLFGVYSVMSNYFQYNVVTAISMDYHFSLPFPSVTVCNENRIHCRNLHGLIVRCMTNSSCSLDQKQKYCSLMFLTDCLSSVELAEMTMFGIAVSNMSICDEYKDQFRNISMFQIEAKFYEMYLNLTWDEHLRIAHQARHLISECSYSNMPNSPGCLELMQNPTTIFTPRHGICYIFNFAHIDEDKDHEIGRLTALTVGQDFGLSLTLNLEVNDYMGNGLTSSLGASVTLQSLAKVPQITSDPIEIGPNKLTNIKAASTIVTRMSDPYKSNCTDRYPIEYVDGVSPGTEYSLHSCNTLCLKKASISECGCVDPLSDLPSFGLGNFSYCSSDPESEDQACLGLVVNSLVEKVGACPCEAECKSTIYRTQIASKQWPNHNSWSLVAQKFKVLFNNLSITYDEVKAMQLSLEEPTLMKEIENMIKENFLTVNIYVGSKFVETISEEGEYSAMTLLSSLGGAISLYLGVSLVSTFELLELVLRTMFSCFNNSKK